MNNKHKDQTQTMGQQQTNNNRTTALEGTTA